MIDQSELTIAEIHLLINDSRNVNYINISYKLNCSIEMVKFID